MVEVLSGRNVMPDFHRLKAIADVFLPNGL